MLNFPSDMLVPVRNLSLEYFLLKPFVQYTKNIKFTVICFCFDSILLTSFHPIILFINNRQLLYICRVEPTQLAFVILGASMAALALMILVTAILATGDTRVKVYKSSAGRVGGRIASACFIFIT